MPSPPPADPPAAAAPHAAAARRARRRRILFWSLAVWAVAAYIVVPRLWALYFHEHPYSGVDRVTRTGDGHPGDPVNIALLGTRAEVVRGMQAAGWAPADPITLKSSLEIAADSVLRRPDPNAPVSTLLLFGRRQDLAFEKPVGDSPRQRHHVRYWEWNEQRDGRPVWFGAATYDERVGLSYTTGEVTHHIGPDVDGERDRIAAELSRAGCVQRAEWIDAFHAVRDGRNGGGDPWRTDGRLAVVVLKPCTAPAAGTSR
jgi:LssY C-terminus